MVRRRVGGAGDQSGVRFGRFAGQWWKFGSKGPAKPDPSVIKSYEFNPGWETPGAPCFKSPTLPGQCVTVNLGSVRVKNTTGSLLDAAGFARFSQQNVGIWVLRT